MARRRHRPASPESAGASGPDWDPVAGLIGLGLRNCMARQRGSNARALRSVEHLYVGMMGLVQAQCVLCEIDAWSTCLGRHAARKIELACLDCPHLSRDEHIAVAMVAAAQYEACPAMQMCAQALLGSDDTAAVLKSTRRVADVLMQVDLILQPDTPAYAMARSPEPSGRLH